MIDRRLARWALPGTLALALISTTALANPAGDRLTQAVKTYESANAGGEDDDGGGAEATRWRLPQVGPAADAARKAKLVEASNLLDGVDAAALTPDQRLTAQILKFTLDERIEGLSFDESRMPFSSDGGFDVTCCTAPTACD